MITDKPSVMTQIQRLGKAMFLLLFIATSCIDEDLSRCGQNYSISYQLKLSLSLQETFDKEFITADEQALAAKLRTDLSSVLSDRAKLMDLSFFKAQSGKLEKHNRIMPNANETSLTVYMKRGEYYNVALAATNEVSSTVNIQDASSYSGIRLRQADADTIDAYSSAIYMGLELITMAQKDDRFFVPLYMVNSVPVLVINTASSSAKVLYTYVQGTATGLQCSDSTFTYNNPSVMRTRCTETGSLEAYHCVCFPSPNATAKSDDGLWRMDVYTQTADNKYVKNVLDIKEPLLAGNMLVIKAFLKDDGTITTDSPEVGVSVELDWNPGGDFDIEM